MIFSSFHPPLRTLVHGVTWKGGHDIPLPSCVQQQEKKNWKTVDLIQGTVKVAKLEGDTGWPCLIASSVYDIKPVCYLSMVSNKVKWIVEERLV